MTTVMPMPTVVTLWVVSCACAMLDLQEMESVVKVQH
jgi:hypothetical protein